MVAGMWGMQIETTGGPEVMQWVELPDPSPGAGEVTVELDAAGLNFADIYRQITNRIEIFVNLPITSLDRLALQKRLDEIGDMSREKA